MTAADAAVVVVGPNAIRGPGAVDGELVTVALECIDDRLALVDYRAVPVERLWHEVMCSAADARSRIVAVVPSWWPRRRSSFVTSVLSKAFADVVVLRRNDVLQADESCAVVEIADDHVVVHSGDAPSVLPRTDDPAAVVDRIGSPSAVVIDVPCWVADAGLLGDEIARRLRARGTTVSLADDDTVLRTIRATRKRQRGRRMQPRVTAVSASVLAVVALACAAVGSDADAPADQETVWVVEGRVAVEVPANWTVERVMDGPGSARLQAVSPSGTGGAIHLVQSPVPTQQSLVSAAEVLKNALGTQPEGVFVDFKMADRRADRPAITYREVRQDRHVDWTVFLDGGVRIAIGCQRAPDGSRLDSNCERAIRSARVLGR